MPYVEDRVIHDADAHTMEPPEWLDDFATDRVIQYAHDNFSIGDNEPVFAEIEQIRRLHTEDDFRSEAEAEVMLRKNYRAHGAWDAADRSEALDYMGFASQLVFPTMPNTLLEAMEHTAPPDLTYEAAAGANRAQIEVCAQDCSGFEQSTTTVVELPSGTASCGIPSGPRGSYQFVDRSSGSPLRESM